MRITRVHADAFGAMAGRTLELGPGLNVIVGFAGLMGAGRTELAHAILSMLAMDDRGFTTELTVWATNQD